MYETEWLGTEPKELLLKAHIVLWAEMFALDRYYERTWVWKLGMSGAKNLR